MLTQRSMFIGAILASTQPLLELIYQGLSNEEPEVHSKAAFAVGGLVEQSTVSLSLQYPHLLAAFAYSSRSHARHPL